MDFQYRNGEEADLYTILESLGGGVALLDYDHDGKLDIFLTGGGSFDPADKRSTAAHRLYHNEGNGRFRDATAEAGLDKPLFYSNGVAVADYDNDGWPDLLVTGYGRMALYHNNHGKFEEVTESAHLMGPNSPQWSTCAGLGRLRRRRLARPVRRTVRRLVAGAEHPVSLARAGRGAGRVFPDAVCSAAAEAVPEQRRRHVSGRQRRAGLKPGKSLGAVVVDVDEDGRPDIYVANDTMPNQLYLNRGGGKFEEVGVPRGVALNEWGRAAGSMGVDAADYDGSDISPCSSPISPRRPTACIRTGAAACSITPAAGPAWRRSA